MAKLTTYHRTTDPDAFEEVTEQAKGVSLSEFERKRAALIVRLDNLPGPKRRPDVEAMEFWNAIHITQEQREALIQQVDILDNIITRLNSLPALDSING